MSDNECHAYQDRGANTSYVGDPFVGVPIPRDIVELVADQYSIEADSLARLLREVRNKSLIGPEVLFTGFDPLQLDGTTTDCCTYWPRQTDVGMRPPIKLGSPKTVETPFRPLMTDRSKSG